MVAPGSQLTHSPQQSTPAISGENEVTIMGGMADPVTQVRNYLPEPVKLTTVTFKEIQSQLADKVGHHVFIDCRKDWQKGNWDALPHHENMAVFFSDPTGESQSLKSVKLTSRWG